MNVELGGEQAEVLWASSRQRNQRTELRQRYGLVDFGDRAGRHGHQGARRTQNRVDDTSQVLTVLCRSCRT